MLSSRPMRRLVAALLAGALLPAAAAAKAEFELELDPYYSDASMTVSLSSAGMAPAPVDLDERQLYRDLARNLVPRFLIVEASVNPMPIAGAVLRNNTERGYRRAKV